VDAFAAPFVQGRLRNTALTITINTECAHCGRPMEIEVDSEINVRVKDQGCDPIAFVPDVNLFPLKDKSIINAF
jgi:hypothetical protein